MYFAAFLFWVTGIVALIISLMTPPDEQYKVCNFIIIIFDDKLSLLSYATN